MNAKQLVEFAADLRLDVPGAKLALLVAVEGFESAEITRLRAEVEALRADAQAVAALLPGPYYMDPPDGGSVTVIEQLRRMAADAARYRWLRKYAHDVDMQAGEEVEVFVRVWFGEDKCLERTLDAAIDAARAVHGDK